MQLPDVNVLIYAHREDAPEHDRYAAWLRAVAEADEPFAAAEIVLASFLRIVTNGKIFESADADEDCDGVLSASRRVAAGSLRHAKPATLGSVCRALCRHSRSPGD